MPEADVAKADVAEAEPAGVNGPCPPFAALHAETLCQRAPLRHAISAAHRCDEAACVQVLLAQADRHAGSEQDSDAVIHALAQRLVTALREKRRSASGVDALMQEFSLSSQEGIALMCLAEALLRIPDHDTADRLIADKISRGDWRSHLGESPSLFVNAATWGLMLTGKLVASASEKSLGAALTRLIAKGGEPLIRQGVDLAMRMLGRQFVCGQSIEQALHNSSEHTARGYRYSYDMLGEAALTASDAARYFAAYEAAIHAIGRSAAGRGIRNGPGISVKLSALHPRYGRAQRARVMAELLPRLKQLLLLAKHYDIGLNIDAEESERLDLSLDLMEAVACDPDLAGFDGIGFVVQAYQKRSPFVIDYLIELARRSGHRFMLRLVKGAYWDSEIKRAQLDGLPDYPVYTRKVHTDLCYLVCAQKLLAAGDAIYPQFATHNAHTLAAVHTWAQQCGVTDYEFQCLHGMGEDLYDLVVGPHNLGVPCRIYAPVGSHQTLLAYLVRRLLENGANTSFVHQIVDARIPVQDLIADPVAQARQSGGAPHPAIALPPDLYAPGRINSRGLDLVNEDVLCQLDDALSQTIRQQWQAWPQIAAASPAQSAGAQPLAILNPADRRDVVGHVTEATDADIAQALAAASTYAATWQAEPPGRRADLLCRAADLFEMHQPELMALVVREAGRTLPNALAEVREAIDFLRYYAQQLRLAPGATALGVVACISPWNFPLAIFTGQISAALACGNVVLAKPAEQTPLVAARAVQLLHQAGVPAAALQCLPGSGEQVGARLVADARVQGVVFTGSTAVAQAINRVLAQRALAEQRAEITLIAETGGQNALIVDSSALPEQVVQDVISSAFDSAGQRCSALRILCLQDEIADHTLALLQGALQEMAVGNPDRLATDIGPVIDGAAQQQLHSYIAQRQADGFSVTQLAMAPALQQHGSYVAPCIIEIRDLDQLHGEVFGPVLHVLRYARRNLPQLVAQINAGGYGLTLGIHSRIDETIGEIASRAHVGNVYVNRNIVGAVVGVQPFGGEGKSGTGPKAGGPLYLRRLQRHAEGNATGLQAAPAQLAQPELASMLDWARQHDAPDLAACVGHYGSHSLCGCSLLLPGPTGERNTLAFAARGQVLCAALTQAGLLNQLAALLATGNRAVVLAAVAAMLPGDLPHAVRERITLLENVEAAGGVIAIALAEGELAAPLRLTLAQGPGAADAAILPVIDTTVQALIPLWRLVAERALCINTTAAGGNASLMTLATDL